jgi:hypothetical protein
MEVDGTAPVPWKALIETRRRRAYRSLVRFMPEQRRELTGARVPAFRSLLGVVMGTRMALRKAATQLDPLARDVGRRAVDVAGDDQTRTFAAAGHTLVFARARAVRQASRTLEQVTALRARPFYHIRRRVIPRQCPQGNPKFDAGFSPG